MIITVDSESVGPWVCERTGGKWVKGRGSAIGRIGDEGLCAGVLYEDFTGANVVCHIAGEGQWASRSFLALIYHYPFEQLKARRITVPVDSVNLKSIRLVERMGFKLEAVLTQATLAGNLLLYVMFKEDCQYLGGKYALALRGSGILH